MSESNELPKGWSWATISELASVVTKGSSPGWQGFDYQDEGIKFVRSQNIRSGVLDLSDVVFLPAEFNASHTNSIIRTGDVLLTLVGASIGRVALATEDIDGANLNQAVAIIRLHKETLDAVLLVYFLLSPQVQSHIAVTKADVARANFNLDDVRPTRIPLPPKSEQHRIVAKIEEFFSDLDAGVAALKRAKANLKRYRASVLKSAVEGKLTEEWRAKHPKTDPASKLFERILIERRQKWEADQLTKFAAAGKEPPKNWRDKYVEPSPPDTTDLPKLPDSWCWAKLDQLLCYLRNGYFQSPSGAATGTPILRINAVRPMSVDLSETRFLDQFESKVDDYFVENGDLLFTRYNGSIELLGVAGMVRGCTEKVLHPDKLIRVKMTVGDPLPSFVEIAANVGASRKHMVSRARTTAGQTGISGNDIREIPIPLPPLAEQSRIVAEVAEKLSQIEAAETAIEHSLTRAARLRQSILKQAFEGKLVPQDPNDEPASVFLQRIKTQTQKPDNNGKLAAPKRKRTKQKAP